MKVNRSSNSDLYDKLIKNFPMFNIIDLGNRCEISVPNGTKRVILRKSKDIYEVEGDLVSTHLSYDDACKEILYNLVTREMMSLGFSNSQINLTNKILLI